MHACDRQTQTDWLTKSMNEWICSEAALGTRSVHETASLKHKRRLVFVWFCNLPYVFLCYCISGLFVVKGYSVMNWLHIACNMPKVYLWFVVIQSMMFKHVVYHRNRQPLGDRETDREYLAGKRLQWTGFGGQLLLFWRTWDVILLELCYVTLAYTTVSHIFLSSKW